MSVQLLTPDQFRATWPAQLVQAPFLPPLLAGSSADWLRNPGMPPIIVFVAGHLIIHVSFARLSAPLERITEEGSIHPSPPDDWRQYWVIGEETFINGSALWCVQEETGSLFRVDVELESPISLINTSARAFCSSVAPLLAWSGSVAGAAGNPGLAELEADLIALESAASVTMWKDLGHPQAPRFRVQTE